MRRTPLNDGWEFRPKQSRHLELIGAGAEWEPVTLPHDAVIGSERSPEAGPATGYFPGSSWEYRRTIEVPAEGAAATTVLELEGVYRDAIVSVNGTVAGHRPYGYTGFFVGLDHLLQPGENELKVEAMAHEDSRWYSGGGVYRPVWLLEAGPVHLLPDRLEVLTPEVDDGGATVAVAAVARNRGTAGSDATLRVEVLDADGGVVSSDEAPVTAFPGEDLTVRRRLFVADPRRWGPDDPYLYSCRVTLRDGDEVLDEEATAFGIRTLALDPRRGLRVNGETVLLRGACVHHDNGPIGAATIDRAEERRVELLQAAGFNALRSAHNPMSRAMLDACDRLGVLVMDESFDMWGQPKTEDDYARRHDDWWEADVEAMVRKDVNHPSVVMYSIGNEIPDGSTPDGIHRARAQAEKVRALDPSRYVTQAVSGIMAAGARILEAVRDQMAAPAIDEDTGVNTAMTNLAEVMNEVQQSPLITELLAEACSHLDVAGYNYMHARFEADHEAHPNRVIVASETHPSDMDVGWARVTEHPQVIGDFTWTGWDYLGEAGIGRIAFGEAAGEMGMHAFHGEYPWLAAGCGDLDITGHRRPQSYYREIVFGLRTDPYVAVQRPEHHGQPIAHGSPWSWSDVVSSWSWAGHEGAPVTVEVYADADEVELLVNGESVGRQPVERFRAAFETTHQPGELEAVAWRGEKEVGRMALATEADEGVRLQVDRGEIAADPSDLAFVEILTGADRPVTVDVEGPGVLQGLASARPAPEEPYTGTTCTTFDGRALAVIRPTGAGTITVRCEGKDLAIEVR
jgi:beta-galactosidase